MESKSLMVQRKGIIDFFYTPKECAHIRILYQDEETRPLLQQQIGKKILGNRGVFIDGNAIDVMALLCLNQNFTTDTKECLQVAVFTCRGIKNLDPLPLVTEVSGLDLASKILVALSFFKAAMVKRWQRNSAPSPGWYRRVSQVVFCNNGYDVLASHHRHWENFLSEHLV